jgi:Mn-dependent DtxR family transcriptional regulator
MVGRVREIVLPEDDVVDAAGFPDLCALIDQASDLERSILQCLSEHNIATRQFAAKSLGTSLLSINRGVEYLERLGLVTTHADGLVSLRDAATQKAVYNVCHMTAHRSVHL